MYTKIFRKPEMNLRNLIDRAKTTSGMTLGEMAAEMDVRQSAITAWKKGDYKPAPGEIAYLAQKAGLPVLETVAEIEAEKDDQFKLIWQAALGKLRAAGVTACVLVAVTAGSLAVPADTHAAGLEGFKNVRFRQALQWLLLVLTGKYRKKCNKS